MKKSSREKILQQYMNNIYYGKLKAEKQRKREFLNPITNPQR